MKFCAKCGTQMNDEEKMCPQCNFPVFDPSSVDVVQHKPPKKKINKLFIIIPATILATAIVTFAVASSVFSNNSDIEKTENSVAVTETTPATAAITLSTEPVNTAPPVTESAATISFATEAANKPCPAQEYGNHNWDEAKCYRPSQCTNCDAYKDEKLGNHYWKAANCIEPMHCFWCDAYKDENGELGHHDFYYDDDLQDAKCTYCHILKTDYMREKCNM